MSGEQAVVFACEGESLVGIASVPDAPAAVGVVIVVGGPQYRVGSHRQFRLLAADLGARGIASLRFDTRGMGDSSGDFPGFEALDSDIRAAVDTLMAFAPQLRGVVLWGLCDGASAAAFYAPTDSRVCGMVLLNPWIRTEAGEAGAVLKHYYLKRLTERAFWSKVVSGGFRPLDSLASLMGKVRSRAAAGRVSGQTGATSLPQRVADGLRSFAGPLLLVLSGQDLVAREFQDAASEDVGLGGALAKCHLTRLSIHDATHTFSSQRWRDEVAELTGNWVADLAASKIR